MQLTDRHDDDDDDVDDDDDDDDNKANDANDANDDDTDDDNDDDDDFQEGSEKIQKIWFEVPLSEKRLDEIWESIYAMPNQYFAVRNCLMYSFGDQKSDCKEYWNYDKMYYTAGIFYTRLLSSQHNFLLISAFHFIARIRTWDLRKQILKLTIPSYFHSTWHKAVLETN